MKTIHIIVSGRVQGVYFRAFAQKQAVKYGITGFVVNKKEGTVEIIANADQDALSSLIKWCHKGPLMAKVSHVVVKEYTTTENFTHFDIR